MSVETNILDVLSSKAMTRPVCDYSLTSAVAPSQVALAVSLNLRTYLRLEATSTGKVCINLPNIDTFLHWDLSELKQLIPYLCGKGRCSSGAILFFFKRYVATVIHVIRAPD